MILGEEEELRKEFLVLGADDHANPHSLAADSGDIRLADVFTAQTGLIMEASWLSQIRGKGKELITISRSIKVKRTDWVTR